MKINRHSRRRISNGTSILQQFFTWEEYGNDFYAQPRTKLLRKILMDQIVNDEVLMTVFTEVERILNDRPNKGEY